MKSIFILQEKGRVKGSNFSAVAVVLVLVYDKIDCGVLGFEHPWLDAELERLKVSCSILAKISYSDSYAQNFNVLKICLDVFEISNMDSAEWCNVRVFNLILC